MNKICGVDEVGRGSLAGPVISAAVILPKNHGLSGLTDSKKIPSKKRKEIFFNLLNFAEIGIGIVSSRVIDKINILQATYKSMTMAIENLDDLPQKILVDGFAIPTPKFDTEGVIKGDQKIDEISAASIVAKVCRDKLMKMIDPIFPEFDFASNKGYGTKFHLEALKEYKACRVHRKSFNPVKNYLKNEMIDKQKMKKENTKLEAINEEINNWFTSKGIKR